MGPLYPRSPGAEMELRGELRGASGRRRMVGDICTCLFLARWWSPFSELRYVVVVISRSGNQA